MLTGYGWFKDHGREYHVARCLKCGASVQATAKQRFSPRAEEDWLPYLDNVIPCCKAPDYYFKEYL